MSNTDEVMTTETEDSETTAIVSGEGEQKVLVDGRRDHRPRGLPRGRGR